MILMEFNQIILQGIVKLLDSSWHRLFKLNIEFLGVDAGELDNV